MGFNDSFMSLQAKLALLVSVHLCELVKATVACVTNNKHARPALTALSLAVKARQDSKALLKNSELHNLSI